MFNKCLLLIASVSFLFIGCSTQINNNTHSSNTNITLFKDLCTQKGQVSWDLKKDKLICIIGSNTVYYEKQGIEVLNTYPDIYDKDGYDKNGFNRAGYNKNGYDLDGFDAKGINKDTLTQYDKNGKNKDGLTKQEQLQKEHNDALLAIEKEKLLIEKQRLELLKAQTASAQNATNAAEMAELNRSLENLNNQLNYNNQQQLNRMNTYKVKVVGPYGY